MLILIIFYIFVFVFLILTVPFISNDDLSNSSLLDRYGSRWKYNLVGSNKNQIRTNLNDFVTVLEDNDVRYWLSQGTALGAIREGDILLWEDDTDIGIFYEDRDKFIQKCYPKLKEKGFRLMRNSNKLGKDIKMSVMRNFEYIDVDFTDLNTPCMAMNGKRCGELLKYLQKFQKVKIRDREYIAPKEDYLVFLYGEDWMIPKKNGGLIV